MIGRSLMLKVIAFTVITVVGVTYVLVHYIGVGKALFGNGYTVYADMRDSGGLFTTASVTYRGVDVGRVGQIKLTSTGIRVALKMNGNMPIPTDLTAVVATARPSASSTSTCSQSTPSRPRPPTCTTG